MAASAQQAALLDATRATRGTLKVEDYVYDQEWHAAGRAQPFLSDSTEATGSSSSSTPSSTKPSSKAVSSASSRRNQRLVSLAAGKRGPYASEGLPSFRDGARATGCYCGGGGGGRRPVHHLGRVLGALVAGAAALPAALLGALIAFAASPLWTPCVLWRQRRAVCARGRRASSCALCAQGALVGLGFAAVVCFELGLFAVLENGGSSGGAVDPCLSSIVPAYPLPLGAPNATFARFRLQAFETNRRVVGWWLETTTSKTGSGWAVAAKGIGNATVNASFATIELPHLEPGRVYSVRLRATVDDGGARARCTGPSQPQLVRTPAARAPLAAPAPPALLGSGCSSRSRAAGAAQHGGNGCWFEVAADVASDGEGHFGDGGSPITHLEVQWAPLTALGLALTAAPFSAAAPGAAGGGVPACYAARGCRLAVCASTGYTCNGEFGFDPACADVYGKVDAGGAADWSVRERSVPKWPWKIKGGCKHGAVDDLSCGLRQPACSNYTCCATKRISGYSGGVNVTVSEPNATGARLRAVATADGLQRPGPMRYGVRARAWNALGAGPWALAVGDDGRAGFHADVPGAKAPGSAANLTCPDRGFDFLRLAWARPPDGGAELLRYEITVNVAAAAPASTAVTTAFQPRQYNASGSAAAFTIGALPTETAFALRVRAVNARGAGPWVPFRASTTAPQPPGAPGRPTAAVRYSDGLDLTWTEPDPNGSPVVAFRVRRVTSSGPPAAASPVATCDPTSTRLCAVAGLAAQTSYAFSVQAKNAKGWGPWSEPSKGILTRKVGGCTTRHDVTIFATRPAEVIASLSSCGRAALGAKGKSKACIVGDTGLSMTCATCYDYYDIACGATYCKPYCLGGPSPGCSKCTDKQCKFPPSNGIHREGFLACAGLPNSMVPQKKWHIE